MSDRKPGLAGARWADAEHQFVVLERADIGVLCRSARPHRALTQVDRLERGFGGLGVEFAQGVLRDPGPDRPLAISLRDVLSLARLRIKRFQDAPRGVAAVARACNG